MMLRYLSNLPFLAFFAAWLTTFTLASFFHSIMVLSELTELDVNINMSTRFSFIVMDWLGMVGTYGIILLVGLVLSLSLTLPVKKGIDYFRTQSNETPATYIKWYALATGTMMFVILQAMYPILEITVIAGARGLVGTLLQILAGVMGGIVFTCVKYRFVR
jgi:hypothetical protein